MSRILLQFEFPSNTYIYPITIHVVLLKTVHRPPFCWHMMGYYIHSLLLFKKFIFLLSDDTPYVIFTEYIRNFEPVASFPSKKRGLRGGVCRNTPPAPLSSLQLDNYLLDRFEIGDALLFKGFGVYFTNL